jgi:hypothetical protein
MAYLIGSVALLGFGLVGLVAIRMHDAVTRELRSRE